MRDALGRIQSAVIIGGTSDIGLAVAEKLIDMGVDQLILAGRHEESLRASGSSLGIACETVAIDLENPARHAHVLDDLFASREVDLVVITAGVLTRDPSIAEALRMAEVNYVGSLSVLLHAHRALLRQGHGQILVLSSAGVTRPRPSNYLYGSTKAALDFAARGLGDVADSPVAVTVVRPGFVHTKMTAGMDTPPLATRPEQVAEAVIVAVQQQKRGVVYVPQPARWVALLMQALPKALVARIDK